MPSLYYLPPFLAVALASGLGLGLYRRSLVSVGVGALLGVGLLYLLGPLVFFGCAYLALLPELLCAAPQAFGLAVGLGAALGAVGHALLAERASWRGGWRASCAGAAGLSLGGGFLLTFGLYTLYLYVSLPFALWSESGALVGHLVGG